MALSFSAVIEPVSEDDATGATGEMYEADLAEDGYVSNLARAFSDAPEVMDAWGGLIISIRERMDRRRYELATLAAEKQLGSSYCMLAHGSVLASQEVFDVVAAPAARAFLTKVLDGLGFQPDSAFGELAPELRGALVAGRPIQEA